VDKDFSTRVAERGVGDKKLANADKNVSLVQDHPCNAHEKDVIRRTLWM